MDNSRPCKTPKRPKSLCFFIYSYRFLTSHRPFRRQFEDFSAFPKNGAAPRVGLGAADMGYRLSDV